MGVSVDKSKCGVVILAAGPSKRMEGANKVFMMLRGKPALTWTVAAFEKSAAISRIVIVLPRRDVASGERLRKSENWKKVTDICEGGKRRQDSSLEGLRRLQGCSIVMVHDGARVCVSGDIIERGMVAVQATGAAVPTVKAADTMRRAAGTVKPQNLQFRLVETLQNESLWDTQTPQVFFYDLIMGAHAKIKEDVADDAAMVEKIGGKVVGFEGSQDNIKITTRVDIVHAEEILDGAVARPQGRIRQ
jgi:2-C-methyl-D-erythritol 4-phosphate cytidylyltransferase